MQPSQLVVLCRLLLNATTDIISLILVLARLVMQVMNAPDYQPMLQRLKTNAENTKSILAIPDIINPTPALALLAKQATHVVQIRPTPQHRKINVVNTRSILVTQDIINQIHALAQFVTPDIPVPAIRPMPRHRKTNAECTSLIPVTPVIPRSIVVPVNPLLARVKHPKQGVRLIQVVYPDRPHTTNVLHVKADIICREQDVVHAHPVIHVVPNPAMHLHPKISAECTR